MQLILGMCYILFVTLNDCIYSKVYIAYGVLLIKWDRNDM